MNTLSRFENKNKYQIDSFQSYIDLFIQRLPRYAIKPLGPGSWRTKNKPLSDRPVQAHLAGQYSVAVLGKWYPEYAILDIDDRPRGTVDIIRESLELDEKNSMLFTSGSPDSYHILLKPEYRKRPPTVRLLNNAFHNFCASHRIEIYPQPMRPIRLPFGPRQQPLDFEYLFIEDWESKLYWFQKLNDFDITGVGNQQFIFDFTSFQKPSLPTLTGDGRSLFQHGLQAPSTRHEAQFKIICLLWRQNIPKETAQDITFSWIKEKHNGFSKDIIRHPRTVEKEIERQVSYVYENYEQAKVFPDSTHNLFNGYISRPDVEDIIRIAHGSLPRIRFLFQLVKFIYPRRCKISVPIHRDRLVEWASDRTYLKYLAELEEKGILKRPMYFSFGYISKGIKLTWPFRSSSEAVLYDGRSIETFEQTARTIFKPRELRQLIESSGAKMDSSYRIVKKIWEHKI